MRKLRFAAFAMFILMVLITVVGCAAGKNAEDMVSSQKGYYGEAKSEGGSDANGYTINNYSTVTQSVDSLDKDTATGNTASTSSGGVDSGIEGQFVRQIIRTVSISGETKEFDTATGSIASYITKYEGYVESSSFSGQSLTNKSDYYSHSATYTIRIPAGNLDAFLSEVGSLINVVTSNNTVDDISAQYYDTLSRLETLKAEKDSLLAMFDKASTVIDMLKVEERLNDVIEEIEALTTKLNFYKSKVAYSTVNLSIKEVVEYTEQVSEPVTFGERISTAFKTSWKNFADGCRDFAVGFVYAIPTLLVLLVIFGGIGLIVYLVLHNAKKKK